MKSIKILSFILILAMSMLTVASATDVFSVRTSLNTSISQESFGVSVTAGEILEFSADDLELRLGLEPQSLTGITVTALPLAGNGELLLEGVAVELYEYIPREMLENLCFVPAEEAVASSISFIPKADKTGTAELSISVLAKADAAPQIEDASVNTVSNVAVSGRIAGSDPEGSGLSIRVITPPVNGTVQFDGLSYRYTPFRDIAGKDSFIICAVDSANNFSRKATVSVNIEKARAKFFYTDMQLHPSAYAAIKLREHKIITGTQIGGNYYFFPDNGTTRGEFIMMLLAASGLEQSVTPSVNTGLPNDSEIPYWIKPYVKKAMEAEIWSPTQPFLYHEIPSRGEAVVLTDRAAKITDVKDFDLKMSDVTAIPDWAAASYKNLAAYKMLDLHNNVANPSAPLTHSYSADLIWQLWKRYNA